MDELKSRTHHSLGGGTVSFRRPALTLKMPFSKHNPPSSSTAAPPPSKNDEKMTTSTCVLYRLRGGFLRRVKGHRGVDKLVDDTQVIL